MMTPEQLKAAEDRLRGIGASSATDMSAAQERLSAGATASQRVTTELKRPISIGQRLIQGVQDIGRDLSGRGQKINEAMDLKDAGEAGFAHTSARVTGQVLGGIGDIATEGIGTGLSLIKKLVTDQDTEADLDSLLESAGEHVAKSSVGQGALGLMKRYEELKKTDPGKAADISAALGLTNFAANFLGGGAAKKAGSAVADAGLSTVKKGAEAVADVAATTARSVGKDVAAIADVAAGAKDALGRSVQKVASVAGQVPERVATAAETAKVASQALEEAAPSVRKAVTAGYDLPTAAKVAEATDPEKTVFREMKRAADTIAGGAEAKSPADIAGHYLQERISSADSVRKIVGKELGKTVEGLRGEVVPARQNTLARLQEALGEKLRINNNGSLNFRGTTLSSSENAAARKRISAIWNDVKGRSAFELHQLRQELFESQGGRAKALVKTSSTEDAAVEAIRLGLADSLETISPAYKALNKEYAQIAEPLKKLRQFYRGIENASADILDERSGALLRRLTSNAPSGQNLKAALEEIDKILSSVGKPSQVNLTKLQDFQNLIDELYPEVVKKTGFAGQTALGIKMSKGGITERAIDLVEKMTDATPEFKRKILDELLGNAP